MCCIEPQGQGQVNRVEHYKWIPAHFLELKNTILKSEPETFCVIKTQAQYKKKYPPPHANILTFSFKKLSSQSPSPHTQPKPYKNFIFRNYFFTPKSHYFKIKNSNVILQKEKSKILKQRSKRIYFKGLTIIFYLTDCTNKML